MYSPEVKERIELYPYFLLSLRGLFWVELQISLLLSLIEKQPLLRNIETETELFHYRPGEALGSGG
jgi:hypothetical protein